MKLSLEDRNKVAGKIIQYKMMDIVAEAMAYDKFDIEFVRYRASHMIDNIGNIICSTIINLNTQKLNNKLLEFIVNEVPSLLNSDSFTFEHYQVYDYNIEIFPDDYTILINIAFYSSPAFTRFEIKWETK